MRSKLQQCRERQPKLMTARSLSSCANYMVSIMSRELQTSEGNPQMMAQDRQLSTLNPKTKLLFFLPWYGGSVLLPSATGWLLPSLRTKHINYFGFRVQQKKHRQSQICDEVEFRHFLSNLPDRQAGARADLTGSRGVRPGAKLLEL